MQKNGCAVSIWPCVWRFGTLPALFGEMAPATVPKVVITIRVTLLCPSNGGYSRPVYIPGHGSYYGGPPVIDHPVSG